MRSTHTYVILELSESAYREIREKLESAGYQHAIASNGTIDMHGIGVAPEGKGEE